MGKIRHGRVFGDDPEPLRYIEHRRVAIDTETTGLSWMDDILGISMAWMDGEDMKSCYLHMGQEDIFSIGHPSVNVSELMANIFVRHLPVFHTAGFDTRVLYKALGFVPDRTEDVVDLFKNTRFTSSRSLAFLYAACGHQIPEWVIKQKKMRGSLKDSDSETVAKYARWDAEATLKVRHGVGEEKYQFANKDQQFSGLVWKMMGRGLPVNRPYIQQRMAESQKEMQKISHDLGINPDSPKQVLGFMEKLGALVDNTRKDTLQKYDKKPEVRDIIQYRELSKAIGSWYEPILAQSAGDGRLHSILNPFGTNSYRMSARDPNIQAIPMKDRGTAFGSLKGIFRSQDPGKELWQVDLKQAEVRMAAMLAKDSNLAVVLNEGQDPYKAMSKRMYGTEEHRQKAKSATLAAIYEIGPNHFGETNGLSYTEAKRVLDTFRHAFPALRKASYDKRQYCERYSHVKLYTGRYRFFGPDEPAYKAFNQQVQGSVAELMSEAMLRIDRDFGSEVDLLLQIHDSVIFEIEDNDQKAEVIDEIGQVFYDCVPEILWSRTTPRVKLPIDKELWQ